MTKGKGGPPVFHLSIEREGGRKKRIREILELEG